MFKRHFSNAFVATFLLIVCSFLCLLAPLVSYASAETGPPELFRSLPGLDDLQNDSTQWNIFHDQGYTKGSATKYSARAGHNEGYIDEWETKLCRYSRLSGLTGI